MLAVCSTMTRVPPVLVALHLLGCTVNDATERRPAPEQPAVQPLPQPQAVDGVLCGSTSEDASVWGGKKLTDVEAIGVDALGQVRGPVDRRKLRPNIGRIEERTP